MTTSITVTRVYRRAEGSTLAEALTTSFTDGGRIKVRTVADFEDKGGEFCIVNHDRSTIEQGTYDSIDEDTNELTGCQRPDAQNWPLDSVIEDGGDGHANVELLVDGFEDLPSNTVVEIPVRSEVWPLYTHLTGPLSTADRFVVECSLDDANNIEEVISGPFPTTGTEPQLDGGSVAPGTIEYPSLNVGTIRIVDTEAELEDLEAKAGDAAYVRGLPSIYRYMDEQPIGVTYDSNGDPVATPIPGVFGDPDDVPNWYRTTDAQDILADAITATHLQVATLSAIAADLGTVTLGTGGYLRTAAPIEGETRIEITDSIRDEINWIHHAGGVDDTVARVGVTGGNMLAQSDDSIHLDAATLLTLEADELSIDSNEMGFFGQAPVTKRTDPGDHVTLSGTDSDGTARTKINAILQVLRDYGLV